MSLRPATTTTTAQASVLVVDDHALVRTGVANIISNEPGLRVIAEAANGPATLCGVAVETDDASGLATKVGPVRLGASLEEASPAFWA